MRSDRRDGSLPLRIASRAFSRRIGSSGIVGLQAHGRRCQRTPPRKVALPDQDRASLCGAERHSRSVPRAKTGPSSRLVVRASRALDKISVVEFPEASVSGDCPMRPTGKTLFPRGIRLCEAFPTHGFNSSPRCNPTADSGRPTATNSSHRTRAWAGHRTSLRRLRIDHCEEPEDDRSDKRGRVANTSLPRRLLSGVGHREMHERARALVVHKSPMGVVVGLPDGRWRGSSSEN